MTRIVGRFRRLLRGPATQQPEAIPEAERVTFAYAEAKVGKKISSEEWRVKRKEAQARIKRTRSLYDTHLEVCEILQANGSRIPITTFEIEQSHMILADVMQSDRSPRASFIFRTQRGGYNIDAVPVLYSYARVLGRVTRTVQPRRADLRTSLGDDSSVAVPTEDYADSLAQGMEDRPYAQPQMREVYRAEDEDIEASWVASRRRRQR